jgi:hypothetical protein
MCHWQRDEAKMNLSQPLYDLKGIPLVGLDRNQPLRTLINRGQLTAPRQARYLDPGVIYYWNGSKIIRRASVERWIEECAQWFPGPGVRDFWETIWNISVVTWDLIAAWEDRRDGRLVGGGRTECIPPEPWTAPTPWFPLFHPTEWRGFRRKRLIFQNTAAFLSQFEFVHKDEFRSFLEQQLFFQYGLRMEECPLGMAALAFNAPGESYLCEWEESLPGQSSSSGSMTWMVPVTIHHPERFMEACCHQVFLKGFGVFLLVLCGRTECAPPGWVTGSTMGKLFIRLIKTAADKPLSEMLFQLEESCTQVWGADWGILQREGIVPTCIIDTVEGRRIETDWPWLGYVRGILLRK